MITTFRTILSHFMQRYADHAIATRGPVSFYSYYQVPEGHEPPFFTRSFSWSATKACVGPSLNDLLRAPVYSCEVRPSQIIRIDAGTVRSLQKEVGHSANFCRRPSLRRRTYVNWKHYMEIQ